MLNWSDSLGVRYLRMDRNQKPESTGQESSYRERVDVPDWRVNKALYWEPSAHDIPSSQWGMQTSSQEVLEAYA